MGEATKGSWFTFSPLLQHRSFQFINENFDKLDPPAQAIEVQRNALKLNMVHNLLTCRAFSDSIKGLNLFSQVTFPFSNFGQFKLIQGSFDLRPFPWIFFSLRKTYQYRNFN
ncbi:hypothetical protein MTR67_000811 [Solanum verrucosum]|uniref:Uncharacterized protein n=1 Tax=Solanum verrucosum TaxID=315347 RepID=A0AAF0PMC8_SOLVR|nr:hypothetical protein MTR67_000811 [Solanum verrucosum]